MTEQEYSDYLDSLPASRRAELSRLFTEYKMAKERREEEYRYLLYAKTLRQRSKTSADHSKYAQQEKEREERVRIAEEHESAVENEIRAFIPKKRSPFRSSATSSRQARARLMTPACSKTDHALVLGYDRAGEAFGPRQPLGKLWAKYAPEQKGKGAKAAFPCFELIDAFRMKAQKNGEKSWPKTESEVLAAYDQRGLGSP